MRVNVAGLVVDLEHTPQQCLPPVKRDKPVASEDVVVIAPDGRKCVEMDELLSLMGEIQRGMVQHVFHVVHEVHRPLFSPLPHLEPCLLKAAQEKRPLTANCLNK